MSSGNMQQPPAKKKRMVVAPVSTPPPAVAHDLDIQPRLALSEEISIDLRVGRAKVVTVDDEEQLGKLLQREAERARETHEQWARSPHAAWVQTLLSELGPTARMALLGKQRKMATLAADDSLTRWELSADWATLVLTLWLGADGRTLADGAPNGVRLSAHAASTPPRGTQKP